MFIVNHAKYEHRWPQLIAALGAEVACICEVLKRRGLNSTKSIWVISQPLHSSSSSFISLSPCFDHNVELSSQLLKTPQAQFDAIWLTSGVGEPRTHAPYSSMLDDMVLTHVPNILAYSVRARAKTSGQRRGSLGEHSKPNQQNMRY